MLCIVLTLYGKDTRRIPTLFADPESSIQVFPNTCHRTTVSQDVIKISKNQVTMGNTNHYAQYLLQLELYTAY
jgi:hypothetical protein